MAMPTLLTRCRAAWGAFRAAGPAPVTLAAPAPGPVPDIPRYPPFLQGLPVAGTAQILATQAELIANLQEALAMTDADYQTLVRPLIERYAAFVHLLPASETHHHRGAGGLFRHGLEVAFQCARASRGRLFAVDRLPQERRLLEPRWQLAAAVVGLLHDVGKPVADLLVLDRAGTTRWQPVDETLLEWATRAGIDRYFLRWNGQRLHQGHEVFTTSVFPALVTGALRRWLMDPDPLVWYSLASVLAGRDDQALLAQLMREADRLSVEQDLRENRLDPAALSLGVPIERYLIDTMRALLRDGTWAVNSPGARVWLFPAGLYLVWPDSAQDVVQRLAEARVPGIPRDPDTLADLLLERALARPCPLAASERPARYWRLAPQILAGEQPQWLRCLHLAEPDLLFSGVVPTATPLVEDSAPVLDPSPAHQTERTTGEAPTVIAGIGRETADATPEMPHRAPPTASADSAAQPTVPGTPTRPLGGSARASSRATPSGRPESFAAAPEPATAAEPAEAPSPAARPPATTITADAARAWLAQHPPAGPGLVALLREVGPGTRPPEDRPRWVDGQLFLPYPSAFAAGEGAPSPEAVLEDLWTRDWIVRDPHRPLVRLRTLDGVRGVLLTPALSTRLLALVDPAAGDAESVPRQPVAAPLEPVPPPADPPNSRAVARPPRPASSGAADYARQLAQRLRARDPTLGPIQVHEQALSVALHGPVLAGAKAAGIAEATLIRALRKHPQGRVAQGRFILGL